MKKTLYLLASLFCAVTAFAAGDLESQINALPENTVGERFKKANLQVALEQKLPEKEIKNLLAKPAENFKFRKPDNGIGFRPEPEVWEKNPWMDALYAWAEKFAKDREYMPINKTGNPFSRDYYRNGGPRFEGENISRLLWLTTHPKSKYYGDIRLFRKLIRRVNMYTNTYATNPGGKAGHSQDLYDFFAMGIAFDGARLMHQVYSYFILPSQTRMIQGAADRAIKQITTDSNNANKTKYPMGRYCNRDIGYANILLQAGLIAGDNAAVRTSEKWIMAQKNNIYPDGGYAYIGSQNESGGYHSADIFLMLRYYAVTGNKFCLDFVKNGRNYGLLAIEPAMVTEYWTVPSWKMTWNGSYGYGGEAVAALNNNDPYYHYLLNKEKAAPDILNMCFYRPRTEGKPLPDNFIVFDRNIQGPKGRFGNYSFSATGRPLVNPEVGKQTLVGSMLTLPPDGKSNPIDSALFAVYGKVIPGEKVNQEWTDCFYLMCEDKNYSIVRKNYAVFASTYDLQRTTAGPSAQPRPWSGTQLWIMTPERLVGVVATAPQGSQKAAGIDGRVRFGTPRNHWSDVKKHKFLPKKISDSVYEFCNMRFKLHGGSYQDVSVASSGVLRDARTMAYELRLADRAKWDDLKVKTYTQDNPHYFVVEIAPTKSSFANSVKLDRDGSSIWKLTVDEGSKHIEATFNAKAGLLNAKSNDDTPAPANIEEIAYGKK